MENLGIPELTTEQIEEMCNQAEKAARTYVFTKVPPKSVETLNITVETEGTKPVTLSVDVDVVLSPLLKEVNVRKLVEETVKEAFKAAENYLREIKCRSQT